MRAPCAFPPAGAAAAEGPASSLAPAGSRVPRTGPASLPGRRQDEEWPPMRRRAGAEAATSRRAASNSRAPADQHRPDELRENGGTLLDTMADGRSPAAAWHTLLHQRFRRRPSYMTTRASRTPGVCSVTRRQSRFCHLPVGRIRLFVGTNARRRLAAGRWIRNRGRRLSVGLGVARGGLNYTAQCER